jgi:hypothetical protein
MATRSLEEDKERFAEWRRQKHGGGRIPNDLWQMACAHIPTLGLKSVAQEFRLDLSRLRERAQHFGVDVRKRSGEELASTTEVAFQELSLNGVLGAPPHAVACLVLERPDGIRVRIEGQLPDADYVGKLAACLWK